MNPRYTIGAIVFAGTGTFTFTGVTQSSFTPGMKEIIAKAGGQPSPSFVGIMNQEVGYSATITDIAKAITNIGLAPLEIDSGGSGLTSVTAWFTRLLDRGIRGGSSTHMKIVSTLGVAIPRTLSCRQFGIAELTFDIWPVSSNGTSVPATVTTAQSLPSTPLITELFTLGPVDFNGTTVANQVGWSLDYGMQPKYASESGFPFPTFVGVTDFDPTIRITVEDAAAVSTYGLSGTAQGVTASNLHLAKLANAGTRTADATAEHIKITVNASQGLAMVGQLQGSNNQEATIDLVFRPIVAGSAILTVSGASAITRV